MMWWGGPAPFWPFLMLGFMLICGVVMMVMMHGGGMWMPHGRRDDSSTPLDILRQRFARGEIDQHEYEERKRLLSQP